MKKPLIIVIAVVLGIIATNALIPTKKITTERLVEDSIETGQAAPKHVSGDIPL